MRGINPIYKYLARSSVQIEGLIAQVRQISELDRTLEQVLDKQLLSHCRIGNIQENEISLLVDSPVWATHVQYKKSEIINIINKINRYSHIQQVRVKIIPRSYSSQKEKPHHDSYKSEIGSQCLDTLSQVTEDKALSEALKRLSRRLKA